MTLLNSFFPDFVKQKIKQRLGVPSLQWSLTNLKKNGFYPKSVLDIGAYKGDWTKEVLEIYPNSEVLMIEAQKSKEPFLKKVIDVHPHTKYVITLLSSEDGKEKLFAENETSSQVLYKEVPGQQLTKIQSQKLDTVLTSENFPFPQFIKLDVQGHELEVLSGAKESLQNAEVCLLEVSLLDFGDHPPLLVDVINFMDTRNYQVYDISQFMRRPFDKALFQMDMFFVKKNSKLVLSKNWS